MSPANDRYIKYRNDACVLDGCGWEDWPGCAHLCVWMLSCLWRMKAHTNDTMHWNCRAFSVLCSVAEKLCFYVFILFFFFVRPWVPKHCWQYDIWESIVPNTHRRRRRDKTVSSRRRRRCVLGCKRILTTYINDALLDRDECSFFGVKKSNLKVTVQ